MSLQTHILPFAAVGGLAEFFQNSPARLELPQLATLLRQWTAHSWLRLDEAAPLSPHEWAWLHLAWQGPHTMPEPDDGASAYPSAAALLALQHGHALGPADGWALVTPCHLGISTDSITLHDPATLALSATHRQQLCDALRPLWAEDGLQLDTLPDGRWLARADWLHGLRTPSPERAIGRDVRHWMPQLSETRLLQRLQTEAQMLLYHHPVNDARTAQGLPPINALWFHGTGTVPLAGVGDGAGSGSAQLAQRLARLQVHTPLRDAALAGDFHAWQSAWQSLDATVLPPLLQQAAQSQPVQLLLAGESGAVLLRPARLDWPTRLRRAWPPWRPRDPVLPLLQRL